MVKLKKICLRVKIVNKRTDHLSPLEDSHLAHLSTLYKVETEASTVKQLCKQTKPPPKQRLMLRIKEVQKSVIKILKCYKSGHFCLLFFRQ